MDQLAASLQTLQRIAHLDEQFEPMLDLLAKTKIDIGEIIET